MLTYFHTFHDLILVIQPFIEASVTSDFLFGHVQLALEKTDKNGQPLSSCLSIIDAFNKHVDNNHVVSGSSVSHGYHAHMTGHMPTPGHSDRFAMIHVNMEIAVSDYSFWLCLDSGILLFILLAFPQKVVMFNSIWQSHSLGTESGFAVLKL